ncbi:MAG: DUF624 domain-containing protein [Oscillospiraceae bacterium]|nr:DUF624 domain-containing protein [Oscillospiraceae bacterium]
MKNLFNLDNPFMQMLARVGDLMILSIITLTLCLPVVTFGPAVAALFKTVYALTLDTCSGVVATYFKAFKENFKQAAIVGAAMLIALASFVCDFILLRTFFSGTAYTVLLCLVGVLVFLVLSLTAYLFPLVTRYSNTLPEHMRNAAILTVIHFPKTILMVLIHLSPVIFFFLRMEFMLQTLVAWIFLAPGLIAQADSYILMPVFEKLEKRDEEDTSDETF